MTLLAYDRRLECSSHCVGVDTLFRYANGRADAGDKLLRSQIVPSVTPPETYAGISVSDP